MLDLRPQNRLKSHRISDTDWQTMEAEHDPAVRAFLGEIDTPSLPERDVERLDKIIREHGLKALLSALTHYCYARSNGGDEETFEQVAENELWYRAAKVVETATINDRVRLLK